MDENPIPRPIQPPPPEWQAVPSFEMQPPRRDPKGYPVAAWYVIVLMVAVVIVLHAGSDLHATDSAATGKSRSKDSLEIMLFEIEAKYIVGGAEEAGESAGVIYSVAGQFNTGLIAQRQRFVVIAAELAGIDEASSKLNELDDLIEKQHAKDPPSKPVEMSPEETAVQLALHKLYDLPVTLDDVVSQTQRASQTAPSREPNLDELTPDDRQLLVDELGWFGRLALAPPESSDKAAREEVLRPSRWVSRIIFGAAVLGFTAGGLGFAGLIAMIVMALTGRIRVGLPLGKSHHGIYAETFAIWMVVFLLLQVGAGLAGSAVPSLAMTFVLLGFFGSLSALCWPVIRGIPWRTVRQDIGWTTGSNAVVELGTGLGGYLMALPILGIGVCFTLLLIRVQKFFSPPPAEFDPSGAPAHPIFELLGGNDWLQKILILILAAVAAPIVEETMFRGVLYRHLRDATSHSGIVISVLVSATINAFIFAVIHPQGWVAIPVLMSLAYAFMLMREWRGTILPCMVMHGTSNFLVLSLAISLFSA